jgi:hypothetical protein
MAAFARSKLKILDDHSSLRHVADAVEEGDALFLALTCRAFRDCLWEKFPRRGQTERNPGIRIFTREKSIVSSCSRLRWAVRTTNWCVENYQTNGFVCDSIARFGTLDAMKWAREHKFALTYFTMGNAARGGDVQMVQWLKNNGADFHWNICGFAALGGHTAMLNYLLKIGRELTPLTPCMAAEGGHVQVLEWLTAKGCGVSNQVTCNAAQGGHLGVLRWALGQPRLQPYLADHGIKTTKAAALGGHVAVLEYLRGINCAFSSEVMNEAASACHLHVVKFLHARNCCEFTEKACVYAIYGGSLEILQWLRANGCPWNKKRCTYMQMTMKITQANLAMEKWISDQSEV